MEVEKEQKYQLSQQIFVHMGSVRCIDIWNDIIITGSIDKSAYVFKYVPEKKSYEQIHKIEIFEQFIYVVKVKSNGKGFIVGNKDNNIYVFDQDVNLEFVLEGHQGSISSLSQFNEDYLASGGWDGTARLWDLKTKKLVKVFEGHQYAVTVAAIPEFDCLVSGSQNKSLIFHQISTKLHLKTIPNAHDDIIRDI